MSSYSNNYGQGSRRDKLSGYVRAARELKSSYAASFRQSLAQSAEDGSIRDLVSGSGAGQNMPGSFDGSAVTSSRSGDEEMILFPSYARKHVKGSSGAGSANPVSTPATEEDNFWADEWTKYDDAHAVVDVDVRGWVHSPQNAQGPNMSRKNRILLALARQLVGIPAPSQESTLQAGDLDEQAQKQAQKIVKLGEEEQKAARRGVFSEDPEELNVDKFRSTVAASANKDQRKQWLSGSSISTFDKLSPGELAAANNRFLTRLAPFMAIATADAAVSAFFYNEKTSAQRTVITDASGHFALTAALNFRPTHVKVMASDRLSATLPITISEEKGVSIVSDIDDTVKHSGIASGAREIFRNVFTQEDKRLLIKGVADWYQQLGSLGNVDFHYVSNSPWQLYPALEEFWGAAGLPQGSFHLKRYSGMMQGIFEPVAERKKGSMEKIMRDFPNRKFVLVGDSGEADLEVYMDLVRENPGKVIAVLIRDVTTTQGYESLPAHCGKPRATSMPAKDETTAASEKVQAEEPNLIDLSDSENEKQDQRRGRQAPPIPSKPKNLASARKPVAPSASDPNLSRSASAPEEDEPGPPLPPRPSPMSQHSQEPAPLRRQAFTQPPSSTSSSGAWTPPSNAGVMSRREELFRKRWATALAQAREAGVLLRAWRTGNDEVRHESVAAVKDELRRIA